MLSFRNAGRKILMTDLHFDELSSQFNTKLIALNTCGESTTAEEGELSWQIERN